MTTAYHSLSTSNFSQDWTNTGLITSNDDWSGVPSIVGYFGDVDTNTFTGIDPRTRLQASSGAVDVIANQTNPNTNTSGGVAEFHLPDPVVALQGSGSADAPSLVIHLDATGRKDIVVSFKLRDIDGSVDNSIQAVALQYRLGETGDFVNVPDAYVADASDGGSLTKDTPVSVTLPADVNGAAQLQLRILTTNAAGNDEWIGIDDIQVTSAPALVGPPKILITEVNSNATGDDFFELYNYGDTPIDLSGWKWTDSAGSLEAVATFPAATVLNAGQRLIVINGTEDAFRAAWGLPADFPVIAAGGPGLGKNDGVVLMDSTNALVAAFNYAATAFTASLATGTPSVAASAKSGGGAAAGDHAGVAFGGNAKASAVWDGVSTTTPTYTVAVAGTLGAYAQAGDAASVGSPGTFIRYSATTLVESASNNGQVPTMLTLTLQGATFTGNNGDNLLNGDAKATVANVPAGLTAVLTRTSDTTATLSLSGAATEHGDAQDVLNNLAITFKDSAFNGVAAVNVFNAQKSLSVDFIEPGLAYSTKTLHESAAFDGSVSGKIVITLSGDSFAANLADQFTVANVPAGLTAVLTRTSDTTAELSFTGRATNHAGAADLSNIALAFLDGAFATLSASAISNTTQTGLSIDFAEPGAAGSAQTYIPNSGTSNGSSDASAALALDANWMVVGDDEASVLRVYHREGGAAVKEWNYAAYLGIGNDELDLEGGTRIGNTFYFTGSSGNKKDGADHTSRENMLAVTITGTGAATEFTPLDSLIGLEALLVAWDASNAHGKGANYYGFATLSATGSPESVSGFSIEGLTASLDGSALLLGFRAPQIGTSTRDKALVVALNLESDGTFAGTFGASYELNLGGRGIRSIEKAADASGYLILAGPAGGASEEVTHDFRLFRWDGNGNSQPVELNVNLDALRASTSGSFETIVDVRSTASGTLVQLLQDNGDTLWPGQTKVSKDLDEADQQFAGNWVQLGDAVVDRSGPVLKASTPADDAGSVRPGAAIVLRFDEGIKLGNGSFVIKQLSTGKVIETIAVNSANVSVAFNTVTVRSTAELSISTAYYVEATPGAVVDHYGNAWAGIVGKTALNFTTAGAPPKVLITEVNSNATGGDFFELYNYGSTAIDLSGWQWTDSSGTNIATFAPGTALAAGGKLVVSASTNAAALKSAWALSNNVQVVAVGGPGLGGGDGVAVMDATGNLVTAVNYGTSDFTIGGVTVEPLTRTSGATSAGGHAGAAVGGSGDGVSAVWDGIDPVRPRYTAAQADALGAYAQSGNAANIGSPGQVQRPLLITEINSNAIGGDFIELYNHGSTAIDLSGWRIDDDSASFSLGTALKSGTTIGAGEKLIILLDKSDAGIPAFRAAWNGLPDSVKVVALNGPALASSDAVVLFNTNAQVVTALSYKPTGTNIVASDGTLIAPLVRADGKATTSGQAGSALGGSLGTSAVWDGQSIEAPKYMAAVAGVLGATKQPGAPSNIGSPGSLGNEPRPTDKLLITEINSNAIGGDFIELYNHGSTAIDLSGWRIDDDSASFSLGAALKNGTTIGAGEKLIILLDKSDAGIPAFRAAWNGLPDSVKVVALNGPALASSDAVVLFNTNAQVVTALSYKPTGTNIVASDGTLIAPLVRADGKATTSGQAGSALGGSLGTSAVWDGQSIEAPKYMAAVAEVLGATTQPGAPGNIGSPGNILAGATLAEPHTENFSVNLGGFIAYSSDSDTKNTWTSSGGTAEVNGFGDTAKANDWLISEAFDLNKTRVEYLSFTTWTRFSDTGIDNPEVRVKYSTDYPGTGDPALYTWTELSYIPSPDNSQVTTPSGLIDLSAIYGTSVRFAFHYTASGTGSNSSSNWRVDDVKIEGYSGAVLSVAATDASKAESNSGITPFTFTVTRAGDTSGITTVDYAVSGAAVNADDFGGVLPAGKIRFAAGETSKTITLNVVGDTAAEIDESFAVTLSSPSGGAVVALGSASGTIKNDDAGVVTISSVQGGGSVAAAVNQTVTIEGIVTAYMPNLKGFFIQEEAADSDGNAATSEGIFIYYNTTNPGISDASVGDVVRITGKVTEFNGQTQLTVPTGLQVITDNADASELPAPVQITLPVADMVDWEAVEGMLVEVRSGTADGKLVITDNYALGQYGTVTLTSDTLLQQYTETDAPSVSGYSAYMAATQKDQIILDDGSSSQNPAGHLGRDGNPLSASNTLRAGDSVTSVVGVVDQLTSASALAYETSYRIQPTIASNFTGAARPTAADLPTAVTGAEIKVASANVLNYFTTLGSTKFTNPNGTQHDPRGATNATEFTRQKDKIVANLLGMDADVLGLMEVQNNGFADGSSAIDSLVDALNSKAGAGTYAYVAGPFNDGAASAGDAATAGDDAIMVAIIYKPGKVTPVGQAAVADPAVYDAFSADYGNRVPLAQTFRSNADNEVFTVVVNHFKSKGSVNDPDIGDGQGANNLARMEAARDLLAWLGTNPTGSSDSDILLLGDFNAYSKEDPITWLDANGYNKVSTGLSYSFDGLWGSLDHALASDSLASQVTGAVKWAINAEEPTLLDYNMEYKNDAQDASYYAADAYRSSDHNPILVGLNLSSEPAFI